MNYYEEIKNKLIDNEVFERVKDFSKERNRLKTYFEVGKILSEAGKHYGEDIIGQYSKKLVLEVGKKYNKRTLRSMRQLYVTFNEDIWKPLVSKSSWSNLLMIMPLKNKSEMYYYINQCVNQNLSKRELREKIKSKEYERLPDKTKLKLINEEKTEIQDFVKNPIIIKNTLNKEIVSEKMLKTLILEDLDNFLKELGDGFSYIGNEYKIKIGNSYNYIDLLLFNIKYNSYIVVELKVTEMKKEHIGQVQVYMNYIDKNIKTINNNKTIGLIVVKKDNHLLLEYSSDSRIYETTFLLKNS